MENQGKAEMRIEAGMNAMGNAGVLAILMHNEYEVECVGRDGRVKWVEKFHNLVVTEGVNKVMDAALKTGLASPAWYVGLKGTGSVVAGDTLASHAGWAEINPYTGNRPTWTPGAIAAGSVSNTASKAVFTINAALTVYGAFQASVNTGTSGTLLGAGDFTSSRAVEIGDTLNVTITNTLTGT